MRVRARLGRCVITVPLAQPHLGSGAGGIGVAVALGVSTVSWVVYLLTRRLPPLIVAHWPVDLLAVLITVKF